MRKAMDETRRRREKQEAYNLEHGITPASIVKAIDDVLSSVYERDYVTVKADAPREEYRTEAELHALVARLERDMKAAAQNLEFERAASLRDRLKRLRTIDLGLAETGS
jgi:excinuclease ABC subunit B